MEAISYLIQVDNFHINEFIFYWNYYDQPMPLLLLKPKTKGLTGIMITVKTSKDAEFIMNVKNKIGIKIYRYDKGVQIKED